MMGFSKISQKNEKSFKAYEDNSTSTVLNGNANDMTLEDV